MPRHWQAGHCISIKLIYKLFYRHAQRLVFQVILGHIKMMIPSITSVLGNIGVLKSIHGFIYPHLIISVLGKMICAFAKVKS